MVAPLVGFGLAVLYSLFDLAILGAVLRGTVGTPRVPSWLVAASGGVLLCAHMVYAATSAAAFLPGGISFLLVQLWGVLLTAAALHPDAGRLGVPRIEQTRLIGALGDFALRTACREAKRWWEGHGTYVTVSSHQLRDPGFAEHVLRVLDETGLPAAAPPPSTPGCTLPRPWPYDVATSGFAAGPVVATRESPSAVRQ